MASNNKNKQKKTNKWLDFLNIIIKSFVFVFVWAFIGCNFLFIQKYVSNGEKYLGTLFPDNPNTIPYTNRQIGGFKLTQSGGGLDHLNKNNIILFNEITGLNSYSFPYTWKTGSDTYFGIFKEWIANGIQESYTTGRGILNWFLKLTSRMPDVFTMFIAPIFLSIMFFLTPMFGFLTNMWGQITSISTKGKWFLIAMLVLGIITGLGLTFAGLVGSLQLLQITMTFIFLPLLLNTREVFNIMGDHKLIISALFGLLIIVGAFNTLGAVPGAFMTLTYLYLVYTQYKEPV